MLQKTKLLGTVGYLDHKFKTILINTLHKLTTLSCLSISSTTDDGPVQTARHKLCLQEQVII